MQIDSDAESSDSTATEMTAQGPDVKALYDLLIKLSDETADEEVGGGGGDDAFADFCKAVQEGKTGFIGGGGGVEGQFED